MLSLARYCLISMTVVRAVFPLNGFRLASTHAREQGHVCVKWNTARLIRPRSGPCAVKGLLLEYCTRDHGHRAVGGLLPD